MATDRSELDRRTLLQRGATAVLGVGLLSTAKSASAQEACNQRDLNEELVRRGEAEEIFVGDRIRVPMGIAVGPETGCTFRELTFPDSAEWSDRTIPDLPATRGQNQTFEFEVIFEPASLGTKEIHIDLTSSCGAFCWDLVATVTEEPSDPPPSNDDGSPPPDDEQPPQSDNGTDSADDDGTGFGPGAALAGLGGAGYLLKRHLAPERKE